MGKFSVPVKEFVRFGEGRNVAIETQAWTFRLSQNDFFTCMLHAAFTDTWLRL